MQTTSHTWRVSGGRGLKGVAHCDGNAADQVMSSVIGHITNVVMTAVGESELF